MDLDIRWIQLGFNLFNICLTGAGFLLIKFNDFSHLEKDVRAIHKTLEDNHIKLDSIDKNLAVLAQKLEDHLQN